MSVGKNIQEQIEACIVRALTDPEYMKQIKRNWFCIPEREGDDGND